MLKTTKSEKKIVRPHTLFLGVSCHFESFDTIENASIFFQESSGGRTLPRTLEVPRPSGVPREKSGQKSAKCQGVRRHSFVRSIYGGVGWSGELGKRARGDGRET